MLAWLFTQRGPWPALWLSCAWTLEGLRKAIAVNSAKLLLDPYAKAIEGQVKWNEAVFSYSFDEPEGPSNEIDSAPFMPKCVVTNHERQAEHRYGLAFVGIMGGHILELCGVLLTQLTTPRNANFSTMLNGERAVIRYRGKRPKWKHGTFPIDGDGEKNFHHR